MDLIGGLVLFFILVLLILIRVVVSRKYQSRHRDDLVTDHELNKELRSRLLRYLALFGLTITSALAFGGILILTLTFTNEARLSGKSMDDSLPIILIAIATVAGILGTLAIVRVYKRL